MDSKFINLFTGSIKERPDSSVVRELFGRYNSLQELLAVTEQELVSIKGIGKARAQQIMAAIHLAMYTPEVDKEKITISSPVDVYNLTSDLRYLDREHFVVIGLNTKNGIVLQHTVSIGTLNTSLVHPREIFKPLIKASCASGILVHNHPSGIADPSREDLDVTRRLVDAGKLIGIEILDHIIIGCNNYCSMREKGLL